MHILNRDEVPEQLMIRLKDFEHKILKNTTLNAPEKLAILQRLVDMDAQIIVSKVEDEFENYINPADVKVKELQDYWIQEDIQVKCTTDAQIRKYFAATGTNTMKKLRVERTMQKLCIVSR